MNAVDLFLIIDAWTGGTLGPVLSIVVLTTFVCFAINLASRGGRR